ncbi:MAG: NHLP leader peptide family RiPP precursor [Desulfobacterales bacterium]|nr:NHLP leader peptide family RiPP precursor [Desulfobacterales bacterium]
MAEKVTRGEMEDIIRGFAMKDPAYKKLLLENPKELVSRQMGQQLPDWLKVKVIEETEDTMYFVLPYQKKK